MEQPPLDPQDQQQPALYRDPRLRSEAEADDQLGNRLHGLELADSRLATDPGNPVYRKMRHSMEEGLLDYMDRAGYALPGGEDDPYPRLEP